MLESIPVGNSAHERDAMKNSAGHGAYILLLPKKDKMPATRKYGPVHQIKRKPTRARISRSSSIGSFLVSHCQTFTGSLLWLND